MLLWDERRKLGITEDEHTHLLKISFIYRSQGRTIRIQRSGVVHSEITHAITLVTLLLISSLGHLAISK